MPIEIAPRTVSASKVESVSEAKLPGRPRAKFVFAHHPMGWEYSSDLDRFLPRLKKFEIRPGLNGVQRGANGVARLLAHLRAEGWTVIPEMSPVLYTDANGEIAEDTGYLYEWPGQRGSTFAERWARPAVIGAGNAARVDWTSQFDRAGFDAWRAWLVDSGSLAPPTPGALAQLVTVQRRRASRRAHEAHAGNPGVVAHVKGERARLEGMQAAASPEAEGALPAKRGPGRPRKATADG